MKSVISKSLVAAAVATALGSNAYALNPSDTSAAVTAGNVFYSGGSSAGINAVYWATTQYLVTSSIDVYTDGSGTTKHPNSINYMVVSGTTVASPPSGIPASTNIVQIYRYSGGSFPNGATPEVANTTLPYPSAADLGAASPLAHSGTPTSLVPSYQYASTFGTPAVPDWGLTDEEPALYDFFANLNNLNSNSPVSLSGVSPTPTYDTPFATAVTANVYAVKKNFTRAEVGGILKHTISDWSQLFDDTGTPMTAGPIFILDRGSGSGTKAAGSQYFLNYPGSQPGGVTPGSVSGTNVNSYTGTVLNTAGTALQDIKEASSFAIVDDLLAASAAGKRAIAPSLGIEFPPAVEQNTTGTNDYFFVKINGVGVDTGTTGDNINDSSTSGHTKYTNVINGSYDFWYQTSFNVHTPSSLTGARAGIVAAVKANLLNESLSGAHAGTAFPASVQGVLLDPNTTKKVDAGNLTVTRKGVSPAPLQIVNDATSTIVYGSDPL